MKLALFDFDGTITTTDMYTLFLKQGGSWHRKIWGNVLIAPFYALYKAGLLPGPVMRRIATFVCLVGRQRSTVEEQGVRFAAQTIPQFYLAWAMQRLAWHQAQGHTIVVVSASLDAYLKPWCETMGIELICSELAGSNRLTGTYLRGDCTNQAKVSKVCERFNLSQFDYIYAYGNTEEDNELLALAHERYMETQLVG